MEIDVEVSGGEGLPCGRVLALEEPGGYDVPGRTRKKIGEPDHKVSVGLGTLPEDRMAGRDVLLRHSHSSLGVERSEAGLQVGLVPHHAGHLVLGQPVVKEAARVAKDWRGEQEVALHTTLARLVAILLQQLQLLFEQLHLLLLLLGVLPLLNQQLAVNSDTFDEARGDLHQPPEDVTGPGVTLAQLPHLLLLGEVEEAGPTLLLPRRGGASIGMRDIGHIGVKEQSPHGFAESITKGEHFESRYLNL